MPLPHLGAWVPAWVVVHCESRDTHTRTTTVMDAGTNGHRYEYRLDLEYEASMLQQQYKFPMHTHAQPPQGCPRSLHSPPHPTHTNVKKMSVPFVTNLMSKKKLLMDTPSTSRRRGRVDLSHAANKTTINRNRGKHGGWCDACLWQEAAIQSSYAFPCRLGPRQLLPHVSWWPPVVWAVAVVRRGRGLDPGLPS